MLEAAAASPRGAVSPMPPSGDCSSASMVQLPRNAQADHAGSGEAPPGADSPVDERPDAMIDEHRAEGEVWAQPQAKAESRELLPRPRALEVPERPQVEAGREDLVRDEQDAASAQCYPKFSRTPSSLRKLSNISGNVLADAELDHCETFAIPSTDVEVGAYIGMGACCHVMRGAWRGRSVAIKTIKICDSAGADDAADNNSKSKDIIKEIALMCRSFATVSHPNIVGFYGICIDGPQPWLIMEYVGGGSCVCVCARARVSVCRVCVCVHMCRT
jgi:serine/threonine protein kinase